jgi:protein-S-isoprenylcysteine O-methyltransferase Ste14
VLQLILTGQAKSLSLLLWAVMLFIYFLPSLLAFVHGHRRFFIILVLNVLLSPVQGSVLHFFWPGILSVNPHDLLTTILVAGCANLGPGWVVLLAWALKPGEPDPRLLKAQETKYYDAVAALPLILWFAYGALQLRAILIHDATLMADGTASLFVWVQFFSLLAAAAFDLLLVYLLLVRDRPIAKSRGVLPRFFGVVGTFMGVGILQLRVAQLDLALQIFAALMIGLGSLGSLLVVWQLGKSFSIMPEARRLVTKGPYAWVRHPLYTMEMITIAGTAVQFAAPWSWLIAFAVLALLWVRSRYEEQVLETAYPEYSQYRCRTKRFIPGVI